MPISSPQLPALAQDAFQRLHCPNLLSANVADTTLHSTARTGAPCKARMGRVPLPAKRESTLHPYVATGATPVFSLIAVLGRSRGKLLDNICCPPQQCVGILSWWTTAYFHWEERRWVDLHNCGIENSGIMSPDLHWHYLKEKIVLRAMELKF